MHPRDLPPFARSRPFSTTVAQSAGISRARLRRTDLISPFHGVRVLSDEPLDAIEDRCRAYSEVMPAGSFFSHSTAAELYGIPIPPRASGAVHVSAVRPARAPRAAGVLGHRITIDSADLRLIGRLPVPSPAEVLCELAAMLTLDELVIAGDATVRRKRPLCGIGDLRRAALAAGGRPGVGTLREALTWIRPRTDSPMETVLRLAIVRSGLPEPAINHRIQLGTGGAAHADLAYPERRIAIEYDGDHHRTDARQYRADIDRLWEIESCGWRIVRVNHSHMAHGAGEAIRRVRSAMRTVGRNTP